MATLIICAGAPASGKSTYCKSHFSDYKYISRDEIRFSKLQNDEDYFAHEKEVYFELITTAADSLSNGKNTIVDSTNLNKKAREILIKNIKRFCRNSFDIEVYCFEVSLDELKRRNATRKGRACVPDLALEDMFNRYERAEYTENELIKKIVIVSEKGESVCDKVQ